MRVLERESGNRVGCAALPLEEEGEERKREREETEEQEQAVLGGERMRDDEVGER